ncbi:MAG: exodeoxyribonuclease I [Pseudomonadales bacterium]
MDSFYWYDLETTGISSRWDRIVQFAGQRTDLDLNPIGEPLCTYVQLADDALPNPDAALVTGITPAQANREGLPEWRALQLINEQFAQPGTCVLGYNSLRFDDEFMRYGLYRNLFDPYGREWQNGNSRWDLIDLVRATGALRRDGIQWPQDDDGLPVYKLEELTKANGLEHGHAHDALSDVHATIGMARLIKQQQPKLFDYHYGIRRKKKVRELLEPIGARLCVHVTAMYPRTQFGCAPVVSVCRHPTNSNVIVVADLSCDIEPLLEWPEQQIQDALFTRGAELRPGLKEVRLNRCPFIAGIEVLNDENQSRLGFDMKQVKERARRLAKPGIAQKLMRVYAGRRAQLAQDQGPGDVDAALYDGFLKDGDRHRCNDLHERLQRGEFASLDYEDQRLSVLARRLQARSFPEQLDSEGRSDWQAHVRERLGAQQAPWLTLKAYRERLVELRSERPDAQALLTELAEHGERLAREYALESL